MSYDDFWFIDTRVQTRNLRRYLIWFILLFAFVTVGSYLAIKTMYNEDLDGGVREGPFWVLVGALMPSILIEIGYNSNPIEAKRLKDVKYQSLIAQGIANGVDGYINKNP